MRSARGVGGWDLYNNTRESTKRTKVIKSTISNRIAFRCVALLHYVLCILAAASFVRPFVHPERT